MRRRFVVYLAGLALIAGCDLGEETPGDGRLKIEAFDDPPPSGVEHIYLTITEVSVHESGGGWIVLAEPNTVYDFLEFTNGATGVLVDETLVPGDYSQLRLQLLDANEIVMDGQTYPLRVPSGEETGAKINLDFTVQENELIEIYVDFDASRSITWTPGNYLLHPTFKAFKKVVSGTVAGTVKDTSGAAVQNALIEATSPDDTFSTVAGSTGAYQLILVGGTYAITASADGFTAADTVYSDLNIQAESVSTGYDFTLQ